MADDIVLSAGTADGSTLAADDISGIHHQRVKIQHGADGSATDVSSASPLPVDLGTNNDVTVTSGAITETNSTAILADTAAIDTATAAINAKMVTGTIIGEVESGATFTVQEDGAALTSLQLIDNAISGAGFNITQFGGASVPIGAGVEATAVRMTIATDSTGVLSIDDNGGSLTVDGTVTANPASGTIDTVTTVTAVTDITNTIDSTISGAALTSLQLIDDAVHTDDAAYTLGTDKGMMMMGFAGAQSVNSNDSAALACTTAGILHVSNTTLEGAVAGTEMQCDIVAALPAGTNEIGKLAAGTAEIGKLAAGTATIGEVTIGAATGATGDLAKTQDVAMGANDVGMAMLAVRDDEQAAMTPVDGDYTTLRTDKFGNLKVTQLPDATSEVKFAIIDAASSGDNTIQAAAGAGIKIRVLSLMLVSAGTTTVRFESGAAGTALTGQMNLVANTGFSMPYNPAGWFETADNTLLNLELSAAISVDGCLTYVEV